MKKFHTECKWLLVLLWAVTLFGLLGSHFWLAELTTHFVVQYAIAALFLLICFGTYRDNKRIYASLALLAYFSFPALAGLGFSSAGFTGQRFTLAQFNVNTSNKNTKQIAQWLEAQSFDIVLLQEVGPDFARELEAIRKAYPHQMIQPETHNFGSALIARVPFKGEFVPLKDGWNHVIQAKLFLKEAEEVDLYALHTLPPMGPNAAATRNAQLDEVAAKIRADATPNRILVGDLNLTPYSPIFTKLVKDTGLYDSADETGKLVTWPVQLWVDILRIPIDQLLLSDNIHVVSRSRGPDMGGDHFPVISELATGRTCC